MENEKLKSGIVARRCILGRVDENLFSFGLRKFIYFFFLMENFIGKKKIGRKCNEAILNLMEIFMNKVRNFRKVFLSLFPLWEY